MRLHFCETEPNIWCSTEWTCSKKCPNNDTTHNDCFKEKETNMVKCFYDFLKNNKTLKDCRDGGECPCPTKGKENEVNCMSGCPLSLNVANSKSCCTAANKCS